MDYLKQAEKALEYLAESEEEWARYKGMLKFQSERLKACIARLSNESTQITEAARKRDAEARSEYQNEIDDSTEIAIDFYHLDAKRKRAELTIEMFRSTNAAQKRGNI